MNNDQTTRSAGRIATGVAIPLALIAGFLAFQVLKPTPIPPPVTVPQTPRVMSTAPVAIVARQLDERAAIVCRAFLSRLPDQLRDAPRRQVAGGHEQNAAYGDPAVTVSCGGPLPSFPPTDLVYPISGLCWHADQGGTTWTTLDREQTIVVKLPAPLQGAGSGQWAAALTSAIATSIPTAATKPSGCA